MRDPLTNIPDRSDAIEDRGYLAAGDDVSAATYNATEQRLHYLAEIRGGLSERLGSVLSWLEDLAAAHGMNAGGDPRRSPKDPAAIPENDPYTILDDAAARIEHTFNTSEHDLGWRDGAMLSTAEARDLQAALDRGIWQLEREDVADEATLEAAAVLRGAVTQIEGYRMRTQLGCQKPEEPPLATQAAP